MAISEDKIKELLSINIKNMMAATGINEPALSYNTGISQSAINRIKNGAVCPSLHQALLISEAFDVTIDDLIKSNIKNYQTQKNYIPIFTMKDYANKAVHNIYGFLPSNDQSNTIIGLKCDHTFSGKILNKQAVIITKKIDQLQHIADGTTLLFFLDEKYQVGNYSQGTISPIDNLQQKYQVENVKVLGQVIKIETSYIKDKRLVEKISALLGKEKLQNMLKETNDYLV